MFNRSYLQQVAMIESECEPRKKQPMLSTYTKSPLRDRESNFYPTQIGSILAIHPDALAPRSPFPPYARDVRR
jgi:hypothetical protein